MFCFTCNHGLLGEINREMWHIRSWAAICIRVITLQISSVACSLFRGYHTAVFISARMSWLSVDICPSVGEGSYRPKAWYRADVKKPCDNLFIIRSNLPICQRINYFICHNSLLEYAESNWWMTDRLLWCLYSASVSCNNQSETSVATRDMKIPN